MDTDQLRAYLRIEAWQPGEVEHAQMVLDAVTAFVNRYHAAPWPAHIEVGAVMLAARLWRRRNSPSGVESFGELGTAYVSRYDADLERLLEIGSFTPPAVG